MLRIARHRPLHAGGHKARPYTRAVDNRPYNGGRPVAAPTCGRNVDIASYTRAAGCRPYYIP
ncbi:MAG: hypothetical protein LBI54_01645 [Lachnospiraceae bacterium]|nr:hypothetical protein [Lachnospiraceae bacterium]